MKLVLFCFLVCLVSISYQENFVKPPLPYAHRARSHYVPLYYANGIPAGYDVIEDSKAEQLNGRNNNPLSRLFGNFSSPFNNLITLTSTVTSTVASVITTIKVVNCVPSAEFVNTNATTACARRRRNVPEILVKDDIQPDVPLPLEASALVDTPLESKEIQHPELESSKSDQLADPTVIVAEERLFSTVKYVTVLTTTISFTPMAITSTKSVAGDAGLSCLPSGYVVCSP